MIIRQTEGKQANLSHYVEGHSTTYMVWQTMHNALINT